MKSSQRTRVSVSSVIGAGLLACNLFMSQPVSPEPALTTVAMPPTGTMTAREPTPATTFPTSTRQPSLTPPVMTEAPNAVPTAVPFAHYSSGEPAGVRSFSLHMISSTIGWSVMKESVDSPAIRILRSSDGGGTWHDVTPLERPSGISRAFFLNGDHAWAVQPSEGQVVVWQTGDGGKTWTPGEALDLSDPWAATLTFLDAQQGWLFYGEAIGMYKVPTTVYQSTDGGVTWKIIYADAPGEEGELLTGYKTEFIFQDAKIGWAGVGSPYILPEIVTTRDGGRTWESRFLPPPAPFEESDVVDCEPAGAPFVFPSQTLMLVDMCLIGNEAHRYLYLTLDGGQSWSANRIPGSEGAVDFINARTGWVVSRHDSEGSRSELHRTGNGGGTWTFIRQMEWWTEQLDFVNEQEGWALARAEEAVELVHTSNGGVTWQLLQPVVVP